LQLKSPKQTFLTWYVLCHQAALQPLQAWCVTKRQSKSKPWATNSPYIGPKGLSSVFQISFFKMYFQKIDIPVFVVKNGLDIGTTAFPQTETRYVFSYTAKWALSKYRYMKLIHLCYKAISSRTSQKTNVMMLGIWNFFQLWYKAISDRTSQKTNVMMLGIWNFSSYVIRRSLPGPARKQMPWC